MTDEELFVLNLLYQRRCVRSNRGFHSDKLDNLFRKKFGKGSYDTVKDLRNKGYLGAAGKSPEKYYIADLGRTMSVLSSHGYNVIQGRERPL